MASYLLKNARIVDPTTGRDEPGEIAMSAGRFIDPSQLRMDAEDLTVMDLDGRVAAPGLIDLHVHTRDPGQTRKEDIHSVAAAAAAGGFATVLAMPNTRPAMDSPENLATTAERLSRVEASRILPSANLTLAEAGEERADYHGLLSAGAAALTDDGRCIQNARLMREAMLAAKTVGLTVLDHCEDASLAAGTVAYESETARQLGLPVRPRATEDIMVARDILLCRETGCPVHIQHVSSEVSVQLVRNARTEGLPVTAEATPHHLLLTHEACLKHGANAKMNPPLGSESDRRAVVDAVLDGTISVLASDHAPHTAEEKAAGFERAPFGIVGVETLVPLCLTALVRDEGMPLARMIEALTVQPARILRREHLVGIRPGSPADLTVLDLAAEFVIDPETFRGRGRNTPFAGVRCQGRPVATFVEGRLVS